jgi:hypothetical protein
MAKNIADFFGEKKQDKSKCKNILDYDFKFIMLICYGKIITGKA